MKPSNHNNEIITKPTWYDNISYFFTPEEIAATKQQHRIHLGAYDDVVQHSNKIIQLATENKSPSTIEAWNDHKIQNFKAWKRSGYTVGTLAKRQLQKGTAQLDGNNELRIRKNLTELNEGEIEKLKKAFKGIQARDTDPEAKNSYFTLAGMHWYPSYKSDKWNNQAAGLYCHHHIPRYNPWHRAYMYEFENALRSVEGCEDVTLPYWDFEEVSSFPALLEMNTFKSYKLPFDIITEEEEARIIKYLKKEKKTKKYIEEYIKLYKKGGETGRNPANLILKFYKIRVLNKIQRARKAKNWENFHGFKKSGGAIIGGHDAGHNSIGKTMNNQDFSAFDPIFWFFHCNWDRLWWKWQDDRGAKNLEGLKQQIHASNSRAIFEDNLLQTLPPFNLRTTDVVDSVNQLGVDYKHPIGTTDEEVAPLMLGSTYKKAELEFDTENVSIRVKGVNRLHIPGSFWVILKGDEEAIDHLGFFQPNQVGLCENCVNNAIVNFDFVVPLSDIKGKKLSIQITSADETEDFSDALEDITINARLLAFQD
jgi:hypothetical protein